MKRPIPTKAGRTAVLDIAAPGLPTVASRLAEVRATLARARNRRRARQPKKEGA